MNSINLIFNIIFVFIGRYFAEENCNGDIVIEDILGLETIERCKFLRGSLKISQNFHGILSLPVLHSVDKNIDISGTGIKGIFFGNLQTTIKLNITDVPNLEQLEIPKLNMVEDLILDNLGGIKSLDFLPGLTAASVIETTNSKIQTISGLNMPTLITLNIISLPDINQIEFPALHKINRLEIRSLANLDKLDFPNLSIIKNEVHFKTCPKAIFYMPKLETSESRIFYNSIKDVYTSKLRQVIGITYTNVLSTNITLENLEDVRSSLQINDNQYLEIINLPNLKEHLDIGITLQNNINLKKISIPSLLNVNDLQINEPTLKEFEYNHKISGSNCNILAQINCDEFNTNHSCSRHSCRNPRVELTRTLQDDNKSTNENTFSNNDSSPNKDASSVKKDSNTSKQSIDQSTQEQTANKYPNKGIIDYDEIETSTSSDILSAIPKLIVLIFSGVSLIT